MLVFNMGKTSENAEYIVGIDEVGRGPIAGPVAVGVFMMKKDDYARFGFFFPELPLGKDSKKLTPSFREKCLKRAQELRKAGICDFFVSFVGSGTIDSKGIVYAIKLAISRSISKICAPPHALILLDGTLSAPSRYKFQHTIVKGDEKHPIIALASIVAKVSRDRRMVGLSKKYPGYGFDRHKGYGTRSHYDSLRSLASSPIHRHSFMGRIKDRIS